MLDSFLDLATKNNPFVTPFQTARCSSGEQQLALPKSRVIPSRNIAFASATPKGLWKSPMSFPLLIYLHRYFFVFQNLNVFIIYVKCFHVHFVEEYSCEYGSNKFFGLCALGGVISCGVTHTLVVPLDLVKCRLQVDPDKYKNIINGFRVSKFLTQSSCF